MKTNRTKTAHLPSAGYDYLKTTLHFHVRDDAGSDAAGDPAWLPVYRCTETGDLRTWGAEERKVSDLPTVPAEKLPS